MARMTQEQLDELLGRSGGGRLVHSNTVGKHKVKNPEHIANGGTKPLAPEDLELDIQQWKSPEGHTIRAAQMPDGSWEVLQNEAPSRASATDGPPGGAPFKDDGPEARQHGRRWGWNQQTRAYDRDLGPSPTAQEIVRNASLPADQDPRAETDAERAQRAKDKETRDARPGTKINSRTETRDGRTVTVETWRLPDGKLEDRIDSKPVEVRAGTIVKGGGPRGEDVQAVADPQTGAISYQPIPGAKPPPQMPANAPTYSVDWTKPGLGLIEYAAAVRARTDLTDDQKTKLITEAHQSATATTNQAAALLNAQQNAATTAAGQRNADVSRATSALSNATSSASSAAQNAAAMTKFSSGEGTVAALNGNMLRAAAMGQAFGGFAPTPHAPMGVATQQIMAAPIPGLPTLTGTAGGPWGAGPTTPPAAGAAAGPKPAPVFRPMPPAAYPGAPAAAPAPATPAVPPAPAIGTPGAVPPGSVPAVDPDTGRPGYAPAAMAPTLTGMAGSPWGQSQPMAAARPPGIGGFGAMAGGGLGWYDPTALNRKLLEEGFDPEVVAMLGGAGVG